MKLRHKKPLNSYKGQAVNDKEDFDDADFKQHPHVKSKELVLQSPPRRPRINKNQQPSVLLSNFIFNINRSFQTGNCFDNNSGSGHLENRQQNLIGNPFSKERKRPRNSTPISSYKRKQFKQIIISDHPNNSERNAQNLDEEKLVKFLGASTKHRKLNDNFQNNQQQNLKENQQQKTRNSQTNKLNPILTPNDKSIQQKNQLKKPNFAPQFGNTQTKIQFPEVSPQEFSYFQNLKAMQMLSRSSLNYMMPINRKFQSQAANNLQRAIANGMVMRNGHFIQSPYHFPMIYSPYQGQTMLFIQQVQPFQPPAPTTQVSGEKEIVLDKTVLKLNQRAQKLVEQKKVDQVRPNVLLKKASTHISIAYHIYMKQMQKQHTHMPNLEDLDPTRHAQVVKVMSRR